MSKISNILADTSHRPFDFPKITWRWYQEWNNVLFLHWIIPEEIIAPLIPKGMILDKFAGKCWISLVAFSMENVRLNFTPSVSFISDFHQINLRTYVVESGEAGIYILHIEAQKQLSVYIAKTLSGLPYKKAEIKRHKKDDLNIYSSFNPLRNLRFKIIYEICDLISTKTELDTWLIERYCLFFDKSEKLYRYDVHHEEWKLNQIILRNLEINYYISGVPLLNKQPNLIHFSLGVNSLAWEKTFLKNLY